MILRMEMLKIRKRLLFAFLLLALGAGASYAADTFKGDELYAKHCASCHGVSGISVMPGAPNFASGEGLLRLDTFLLTAIRDGGGAMPAYQWILSDRDILDVIAYTRTLY